MPTEKTLPEFPALNAVADSDLFCGYQTDLGHWTGSQIKTYATNAAPVQSVAGKTGAVTLTSNDVGLGNVQNVDTTNASNITSGSLTLARITAGTSGQYLRGDQTWQTLNPTVVGLGNVPNTDATNASNISSGTLPDARLSSNVTAQGNIFNAASKLVQLDSSTKLPAVDGSQLTDLNASNVNSGTLSTSQLPTVPITKGGTNSTSALNNNRFIISSSGSIIENAAVTASRALVSDTNGLPSASSVTSTELGYVSGVTSAIQTQLNGKEATITTLSIAKGGTNSGTSLNDNRIMKSSSGSIIEASAITASRALISDANGIPTHSSVTSTELGYVSGVTSALQTQINGLNPKGAFLSLTSTSTFNLTTGSLTAAPWSSVLTSANGGSSFWSSGTDITNTSSNTQIWLVSYSVIIAANSTGARTAWIGPSGDVNTRYGQISFTVVGSQTPNLTGTTIISMAASAALVLYVWQDSGSTLTCGNANPNSYNRIQIYQLL